MKTRHTTQLLLIGLIGLFFSCKQEPEKKPDYAIVKGKITHSKEGKKFRLYNPKTSKSTLIAVNKDGNFKDTLRLENPTYFNVDYNGIFKLYLSNGMDLTIDFDAKKTTKSLDFEGAGSTENNYVQFKSKQINNLLGDDYRAFLSLDEDAYNKKIQEIHHKLETHLEKNKSDLDSSFIASQKKKNKQFFASLDGQRKDQLEMNETVGKGKVSPGFKDYKNYNGGTASLKDYRGSYVYIDVWATWCVPCIYEIPYMKKIEKKYAGKNIKFIGLSVNKSENEDKWRKMIKDKNLAEGSTQLLADNALKSDFVQAYHINGIPRFILLDPKGKVISNDAPRPSMPKLKDMFDKLDL